MNPPCLPVGIETRNAGVRKNLYNEILHVIILIISVGDTNQSSRSG